MVINLSWRQLGTKLFGEGLVKLYCNYLVSRKFTFRTIGQKYWLLFEDFSSSLFAHPVRLTEWRMADNRFCIEYAKTGRSSCKKCKQQIEKGIGRIGKLTANPFSEDGGDMKVWFHTRCMFETFKRARATTKKIETPADLEGFGEMKDEEKSEIKSLIGEFISSKSPSKAKAKKKEPDSAGRSGQPVQTSQGSTSTSLSSATPMVLTTPTKPAATTDYATTPASPDNSFLGFCELCGRLEKEPSYNAKTKLIYTYLKYGNSGDGFKGDVYLLVKLLLPGSGKKRVYNLQSKQIVKLMSQVFSCSTDDMVEDLEKGDVAETVKTFFEQSSKCPPAKTSALSLSDVDIFLDRMAELSKEEEQRAELAKVVRRCTSGDLRMIIRMIKHDLRINAGAKHVMDALDPNAYAAFQASSNLRDVVDRVMEGGGVSGGAIKPGMTKTLSVRASIMTPVKPMLAEACRSVGKAMQKCPHGMYAEIKYDGERVQVHKQGDKFQYFSRTLKAVQPHKVQHIKDYLPQACPHGDSMILDCEVLMVDTKTSKPLPFGTLGIHKKTAFKDASCCLFIFDIIYFNGETLMDKSIFERRQVLEKNVKEVKNRIMLSEQTLIKNDDDQKLSDLIMKVIRQGLEGLVLKDVKSVYEPGKRHWLKVKKDYLEGGAMADTADLLVLGGYYGTGSKGLCELPMRFFYYWILRVASSRGGMISVFLMGVYDPVRDKFCTVAKCGNGHDDATLTRLQKELDMVKISKDPSKVPSWLQIHKNLLPDFVVKDPKVAPVWEITGAEFSNSNIHTARGISIRFPRVTRIRDDKEFSNSTDLQRLEKLFKTSKETLDIPGFSSDGKEKDGSPSHGARAKSPKSSPKRAKKRKAESDGETSASKHIHTDIPGFSSDGKEKDGSPSHGARAKSPKSSPKRAKKRKAESDGETSASKHINGDSDAETSKPVGKSPTKHAPKRKAKAAEEGGSTTSKKQKVVCKFGPKCYQTNKKHKEEFLHPWEDAMEIKCAGVKIEQPLPDLFSGVKIYVYPDESQAEKIKKFFTAYDGEVLEEHQKLEATYVITDMETKDIVFAAVKLVKADWIWDSLKQEQMLPVDSYIIEQS